METPDNSEAAGKILAEDSETLMGGSGSKLGESSGQASDVKKDGDGCGSSSAVAVTVVSERAAEKVTTVESIFEGNSGLVDADAEKKKVEVGKFDCVSTSSVIGSVSGIDINADGGGSSDGVFGEDHKVMERACAYNGVSCGSDFKVRSERSSLDADAEDGKRQGNGEKLEDRRHDFRVGDFVWAKIKSHPWWPGQVFDPRDASEFALKHSQEDHLLVAFFGDGSCSWCLPAQLVNFVENFDDMSKDSSSKSFLNAVEKANAEIGRIVEREITCNCIPKERTSGLARPEVSNAGVKKGVLMPEISADRLSIPKYEPVAIIEKLAHYAKGISVGSAFQLAILRSQLSAFYRSKGVYQLPTYHVPFHIEGLEDKSKSAVSVQSDFSTPIDDPIMRPQDPDGFSSPEANTLKSESSSHDKVVHRKERSVAELMGGNTNVNLESQKRAKVKEGTDVGRSTSSLKKKKTSDGKVDGGNSRGASLTGERGRKRKAELSESDKAAMEKVSSGGVDSGNEGILIGEPKEGEVGSGENSSDEAKGEAEMLHTPRERKRSWYLSPPFTDLPKRAGSSSFKMKPEVESDEISKKTGEGTKASGIPQVDKASEEKPPDVQLERRNTSIQVSSQSQTDDNDKKLSFPVWDVDVAVDEFFSEIGLAAVNHLYLHRKGSLDMVWAFASAFRSSIYLHGPDYKVYHKSRTGKKRKSLPSKLGDELTRKKAKTTTPRAAKSKGQRDTLKLGKAAESSDARNVSSCLVLTFTPEFPLPSKEDIVRLFGKFGSLNENETSVMADSHLVRIVYASDSDAEAAFRSSVSQSPFGVENVNYFLQHSSAGLRSQSEIYPSLTWAPERPDSSSPADDVMSDVRVIRQKLEVMNAILENYHAKFSDVEKASVKDEMMQLKEKVEAASDKVQSLAENASLKEG